MIERRRTRTATSRLVFDTLVIEGGLLSPDWLHKVAQLAARHQTERDYRVHKGLNLRDEIGRYWRIAQGYYEQFTSGRERGANAADLSQHYIEPILRDVFCFASLRATEPRVIERHTYPVGHLAVGGRVPVVIAPAGSGLDTLSHRFGEGSHRRSPFGLAQEYLNATDEALWGLVCDGVKLRVVRDNASLTRPAWIEADLARIFAESRFADFAALWLLAHETRFGDNDQRPEECVLEVWREDGRKEGTAARERLRDNVEAAIVTLGQGFVSHPENRALRDALHDGTLRKDTLFQQLLRLAYRLIFLLTAEEREVLHAPDAAADARSLYADGYGLRRLCERAARRSAHDRHGDLWESLLIVFQGLALGEPRLALPALGGIFSADQCPALDAAKVRNSDLLLAAFKLSWIDTSAGIARVNWRDMGPEELGSVYESLLELVPLIDVERRSFRFAVGDETRGNARKTSGSYYTPDALVQTLLDSALEPVVSETVEANPGDPAGALLRLSVVDPACGSGHFLLAAARRLAAHIARLRARATPTATEYRHALREVVGRCIYGVDVNPMAVELCRVSLWMEAVEPGLPLSFLDAHLQCGNALLGATPELLDKGVPDDAWAPLEGDDRAVTFALKKRNKNEVKQGVLDTLWAKGADNDPVLAAVDAFEHSPDARLSDVERKRSQWEEIRGSEEYRHQRFVADLWCAAFVWPKLAGPLVEAAPTNARWEQVRARQGVASREMEATTRQLAEQYRFFHWYMAFPAVFRRGGFDVVLGNPPWERVKLQEQEFFASRDEVIANATNAAARKRLIAELPKTNRALWDAWCEASREAEGQSHFVRQSKRYPLCGKGDVNTYSLFAEHNRTILAARGRAGFIVPTGIATDEGTSGYFRSLVAERALQQIVSFENEGTTFGGVNNRQSFCLLTLSRVPVTKTRLRFNVNQPLPDDAGPQDFELAPEEFALFNPNTGNTPTFRTQRDAKINFAMYSFAGILWRDDDERGNAWGLRFFRMIDMADDSALFRTRSELESGGWHRERNHYRRDTHTMIPLVEAKMLVQFDHRFGTYEGATQAHYNKGFLPRLSDEQHRDANKLSLPDCWMDEGEVESRLEHRWSRGWLLGWRDIARRTEMRTLVPSLLPRAAVGHTFPLLFPTAEPRTIACLYANLCSFVLDYAARQKVGGTHVTYGYLKQLPVLPPSTYDSPVPWERAVKLRDWILARVLELTYTAWDLEAFGADVGHHGPPFRWESKRRAELRAELDAAFFQLYGLSYDDTAYVMETFPTVRRNDEKEHRGAYRTKELVLGVYKRLAEAVRSGSDYVTELEPGPADPALTHAPREETVDVAALRDGLWERPAVDPEGEMGALLVALLKVSGKHLPRRLVRVSFALALEPRLMTPLLSDTDARHWKRLIGREAQPLPQGVRSAVPRVDATWGRVFQHARASGILAEDLDSKTWAPGRRIYAVQTRGWPEARARWVLQRVEAMGALVASERMPDEVRRWVDEFAA